ncbi:MAG: DEAD/DEAH box helicase [Acidimicrobiales bacterium]
MPSPVADFGLLGVPADLVEVLARNRITEPFDIQRATLPDTLAGRDVLGQAPTGSGKTLAFGLPLIARVGKAEQRRPRALILSPTRELAEQIRRELEPLADARGIRVLSVYGGVGIGPQAKALSRGVEILVACPGRLQDLLDNRMVSLDRVDHVVVDEADRMADMGFLPAVRALLDLTPRDRQTVLFSATLDREVKVLVDGYQRNPVRHQVGAAEPDLSLVTHRFITTTKDMKIGLAADLIDDAGPTMVFCRTRHGVDRVARQLKRAGVKAGWIHGGRTQSQRDAALSAFTSGRVSALVATDVAARGIHVDGVACVIHYDPPADHKDYVHRSGRTARAGAGGVVVSMVNDDQRKAITRLQRDVGLPATHPEDAPPLRKREVAAWVDERPESGSRKPNRSVAGRSRPNGGARATSPEGGGRGGRDRSDRQRTRVEGDDRNDRRPADTGGADRGRSGDGPSGHRSRQDGPRQDRSRQDRPRQDRSAQERRDDGGGGGQRPAPATGAGTMAGSSTSRGGKAKATQSSKRSGRPRAKSHKQSRRGSGSQAPRR